MTDKELDAKIAAEVAKAVTPVEEQLATARRQVAAATDRTRFRDLMEREALRHRVLPQSLRHVLRDAEEMFTLKEGAIVPKDGQTEPGDPLVPLSPSSWLAELREKEPFLFV